MQQEINYNYTKLSFTKLKKSTIVVVYNELTDFHRFSTTFKVINGSFFRFRIILNLFTRFFLILMYFSVSKF